MVQKILNDHCIVYKMVLKIVAMWKSNQSCAAQQSRKKKQDR